MGESLNSLFDFQMILRAVGAVGFAFFILGYFLLQIGQIRGNGHVYRWLNLLAATFVLMSLLQDFHLELALILISWIAISLVGILRAWRPRVAGDPLIIRPEDVRS